jgi:hypothetical protein
LAIVLLSSAAFAANSSMTLEALAASGDVVAIARVTSVGVRQSFCEMVELEIVRTLAGKSGRTLKVCLNGGDAPVLPKKGDLVLAAVFLPESWFSEEFPGVYSLTGGIQLPVVQNDRVRLFKGGSGVLSHAVPGSAPAKDLPSIEVQVADVEAALAARAKRIAKQPSYQMETVTCGRRCARDQAIKGVASTDSFDCAQPTLSDVKAIQACFDAHPRGAVHAHVVFQGIDSQIEGTVFRDAGGRWHVVTWDSNVATRAGSVPSSDAAEKLSGKNGAAKWRTASGKRFSVRSPKFDSSANDNRRRLLQATGADNR